MVESLQAFCLTFRIIVLSVTNYRQVGKTFWQFSFETKELWLMEDRSDARTDLILSSATRRIAFVFPWKTLLWIYLSLHPLLRYLLHNELESSAIWKAIVIYLKNWVEAVDCRWNKMLWPRSKLRACRKLKWWAPSGFSTMRDIDFHERSYHHNSDDLGKSWIFCQQPHSTFDLKFAPNIIVLDVMCLTSNWRTVQYPGPENKS